MNPPVMHWETTASNIFSILMLVGAIIVYIIFLVAVWRLMRAHESIADSVRDLAEYSRSKAKP